MSGVSTLARGAAAVLALQLGGAADVHAFCGFFVSGADAALTNNASQVVLLRNAPRLYNAARRAQGAGRLYSSIGASMKRWHDGQVYTGP